jgi:TonB family protein
LILACALSTIASSQTENDKTTHQEKKSDEQTLNKKLETTSKNGIEILSDTMGVDFGPYMKHLKATVQNHWDRLIPEIALPPLSKSGTVTVEFAIMTNGQVKAMKLVKSSGDLSLDRAAWGGIIDAIPLPALPLEFKGDYLRLRCNFIYNPVFKAVPDSPLDPKK